MTTQTDGDQTDSPAVYQRLDQTAGFPYRRSEYLRKAAWMIVYATVYRLAPGRCAGWRRFWLRLFGAKIKPTCNVWPSAKIHHPWLLTMGDHSCIAERVVVYNLGPVTIGTHTVISQDVHLCAGTHDYSKMDLPLLRPPIEIGHGVWVCAKAFIGPGVTIGDNAIVGACAVVAGDVPSRAIVAGNPARQIKERPAP